MSNIKIEELTKDINELKTFIEQSKRPRIKDYLSIEVRKFETELISLREAAQNEHTSSPTKASAPATGGVPKRYEVELNQYAFDQSDKFVKLFVTLDGVQACTDENVIAQFTNNSICLYVKDFNNKDYKLEINNLLEPIDVSKSYRKIKTNMISIYAKKVKEGVKWSELTVIQKRLSDIKQAALSSAVKPDDDLDPKDPTAGLMKVMKQMYDSGDSEMKRMISKAWVEGEEKKRAGLVTNDMGF